MESANECGGVSFCCRTTRFGEKRRERNYVPTDTQKVTVYVLVVFGLEGQLAMKEKTEELYNARTRTVLRMGTRAYLSCWKFPEEPSKDVKTAHDGEDTQHLSFDVAEHFTRGAPETLYSDGKHESRLDNVLADTAALRAVRRFEVSQSQ